MMSDAWTVLSSNSDKEYIVTDDKKAVVRLLDAGYKLVDDVYIRMVVIARLMETITHSERRIEDDHFKNVHTNGISIEITVIKYNTQYWQAMYYKTGIRANCWDIWSLLFPITLGIKHEDNNKKEREAWR